MGLCAELWARIGVRKSDFVTMKGIHAVPGGRRCIASVKCHLGMLFYQSHSSPPAAIAALHHQGDEGMAAPWCPMAELWSLCSAVCHCHAQSNAGSQPRGQAQASPGSMAVLETSPSSRRTRGDGGENAEERNKTGR